MRAIVRVLRNVNLIHFVQVNSPAMYVRYSFILRGLVRMKGHSQTNSYNSFLAAIESFSSYRQTINDTVGINQ